MSRKFPKSQVTIVDLFDRFSDEKTCREFLFDIRFAKGFACPYCGDSRYGKIESRGLYRCKGCRKQISPTSGTFMHGTHIKLRIWIIAAYLFMTDKGGMSAVNLMRKLGVTYKTAWYILHRFRKAMKKRDERYVLDEIVEFDDTSVGGPTHGKKRGRGSEKTNVLCVRLVFCLYAEDAGIFGTHEMFGQYLAKFPSGEVRKKLIELFEVFNTKPEDRDPYMEDDLAAFPYVNGGLFAEKNIEIPRFNDEIVDLLVNKASAGFDWSDISPTIFGAVFESTLNPETRRKGGMHYTSIENIHKVIDPLFLDGLKAELAEIMESKQINVRNKKLEAFRDKIAALTFLDPACGSGNFLTETYLSLRRLENEAIAAMLRDNIMFADTSSVSTVKVSIGQFYGIEINDFAVTVAKTALWIAEAQMLSETEKIINRSLDFLPLKSYANIVEGNALRLDWESVVSKDKLSYINIEYVYCQVVTFNIEYY